MKQFVLALILIWLVNSLKAQTMEIETKNFDTINKINVKGFKEGKWVISGRHNPKLGYSIEQVIETGNYLNNRKTGVWKEYYRNGKQRSQLTYVNGVLDGPATFYDTTGKPIQEGYFKGNKWVR